MERLITHYPTAVQKAWLCKCRQQTWMGKCSTCGGSGVRPQQACQDDYDKRVMSAVEVG